MAKKLILWSAVILIIAGAAVVVYHAVLPKPVAVAAWEMKKMDLQETVTGVAAGYAEPAKRVSIDPDVSARIKEVKVKRGDRMKAGQTLVLLDDSDFQDQLRALDAAIPLFEARVKQAQTHASQIRQDFNRAKKLSDAGTLTVQQYETAKMALDLGIDELDAAEAALHQAQVNRGVAFSALRKTQVKAPFDGLVLDSSLEVGQLWTGLAMASLAGVSQTPGLGRPETAGITSEASTLLSQAQPPLSSQAHLELADDSQMFVVIDVDENDYEKLKPGQTASLTIEALGKRKVTGSLVEIFPFISRALDQNRTARVKIRLGQDSLTGVVPGMSVNAEIIISSRTDVLAAPTAAILIRPKGKIVYRVTNGKLRETTVETGLSSWEWTEITAGLAVGDRIAKRPEDAKLKDGLRVVEKDRDD